MLTNNEFKEWIKERNEAVESLNLKKFKAFYRKWQKEGVYLQPLPEDKIVELAMYKSAVEILSMPEEVKEKALKWLKDHNSGPIDWSEK